jgi:outer membrane lipoprotein-sorting protein
MEEYVSSSEISVSLVGVFLLATGVVFAQDAQGILSKVAETYSGLSTYHFEGVTTTEMKSDAVRSKNDTNFEFALNKPDKVKVEFRYQNAGTWLRVSDGKTLTRYRSVTGELKQEPASPSDMDIANGTPISDYQEITERLESAKVAGSETVRVGDSDVDCYVIEALYKLRPGLLQGTKDLPTKYWIDKKRFLVLKEVSGTESQSGLFHTQNLRTTTFTMAWVNQPVPDAVFAFDAHK